MNNPYETPKSNLSMQENRDCLLDKKMFYSLIAVIFLFCILVCTYAFTNMLNEHYYYPDHEKIVILQE